MGGRDVQNVLLKKCTNILYNMPLYKVTGKTLWKLKQGFIPNKSSLEYIDDRPPESNDSVLASYKNKIRQKHSAS